MPSPIKPARHTRRASPQQPSPVFLEVGVLPEGLLSNKNAHLVSTSSRASDPKKYLSHQGFGDRKRGSNSYAGLTASAQRLADQPVSPHLQIYRLQFSSFLSISNRIVQLSLLMWAYIASLWVLLFPDSFSRIHQTILGRLFCSIGLFSFGYLLLGMARHKLLDWGIGSTKRSLRWVALVMLFLSVCLGVGVIWRNHAGYF